MKMLIDIDRLEREGALAENISAMLRRYAVRETGSTAIHLLLVFGAIAVAAGVLTLIPQALTGAVTGLAFILCGVLLKSQGREQWGRLGGIAMIVGALVLSPSAGMLVDKPFTGALAAAIILAWMAVLAKSRFLSALIPFALAAAIGGSTGYWHACYELCVREPLITIVVFTGLAITGWEAACRFPREPWHGMAIVFARISVILVNFGFWIGSLWGDIPGHSWTMPEPMDYIAMLHPTIAPWVFVAGWAGMLAIAAIWGLRQHNRFMVNAAVVFGAIQGYTQWFEYFHLRPDAVILAGLAAILLGLGLWHYNQPPVPNSAN